MKHFTPGANISERAVLPPPVAVSTVIFSLRETGLWMPLVRRVKSPFAGLWALPGGPVTWNESLTDVATRTLQETTGLAPRYLEQLYTFGEVDRSPADRVISIVYWALIDAEIAAQAHEADNVAWFPADDLPDLAFDHREITQAALWRLRNKIEYATVAHHFLGDVFTLAQLRQVYEAVLGKQLDVANFRRQVLSGGEIEETGESLAIGAHRPAKLYRYVVRADPAAPPLPPG